MKWGDVKLCTTNTGTEYLQYSERNTKTRTGANPGNTRDVTPKSWSNLENSDRCHVAVYKKYKELSPILYFFQHSFWQQIHKMVQVTTSWDKSNQWISENNDHKCRYISLVACYFNKF